MDRNNKVGKTLQLGILLERQWKKMALLSTRYKDMWFTGKYNYFINGEQFWKLWNTYWLAMIYSVRIQGYFKQGIYIVWKLNRMLP